jgi:hypothetical protein
MHYLQQPLARHWFGEFLPSSSYPIGELQLMPPSSYIHSVGSGYKSRHGFYVNEPRVHPSGSEGCPCRYARDAERDGVASVPQCRPPARRPPLPANSVAASIAPANWWTTIQLTSEGSVEMAAQDSRLLHALSVLLSSAVARLASMAPAFLSLPSFCRTLIASSHCPLPLHIVR